MWTGYSTSPTLTPNPTTLTGLTYVVGSAPGTSATGTFNLTGSNLTAGGGSITVTGSTNYVVSSDNTTFGSTATLTYTGTSLASTPVYVRLKSGLSAGTYNAETISISGGGATSSVTVSGSVYSIVVTPGSLTSFTAAVGAASAAQSYNLTGNTLPAAVTVKAPTGYQVSTTAAFTSITTDANTLTVPAANAASPGVTIYVRLSGLATPGAGTYGTPATPVNITNVSGSASQNVAVNGNTAGLTLTPSSLSGFTYAEGSGPSAEKTFTVTGAGLTPAGGNLTAASATANYEVSLTSGGTFSQSISIPYTGNSLSGIPVYVRLKAGLSAGNYNTSESIAVSGGNAAPKSVTLSGGTVSPSQVITAPATLATFGGIMVNSTAADQTITVSGTNLSAPINVSSNAADFTVSNSSTGPFASTATLPAAGGTLYVRFTPSATGSRAGTLTYSSTGAANVTTSVSGTGSTLTASPLTLSGFSAGVGSASASQTYTLTGVSLVNPVLITAPTGYEVRVGTSGSYASTQSASAAVVNGGATIYVRLASTAAAGPHNGLTITNTAGTAMGNPSASVTVSGSVGTLTATPTSLSGFVTTVGTPSAPQSYVLTGINLLYDVDITLSSTPYEISLSSGSGYGSTLTVPVATVLGSGATVYVRLKGAASGTFNGQTATNKSGTATGVPTATVTLSGSVTTPTITVSPTSLSGFATLAGNPSTQTRTYTVSGSSLIGNVTVQAPTGYQVALSNAFTGATDANSLTLTPTGGALASTTIYVRLTGTGSGTVSGSISNTSPTATTRTVSVSGTVVVEPTAASIITASDVDVSSVTLTLSNFVTGSTGKKTLIVVRAAGTTAVPPVDQTTYTASSVYGEGSTTGPGNFVVLASDEIGVDVTGLAPGTSYIADEYEFNDAPTAGFENYLTAPAGTTTFITPTLANGVLLLEDNFAYAAGTPITAHGWSAHTGGGTNPITTVAGNLTQPEYPQGFDRSLNPTTYAQSSTARVQAASGEDVNKTFARPAGNQTLYVASVMKITSAPATPEYFMHLFNGSTALFRGKVFTRAATGGFNFGLSLESNAAAATFSPTTYLLNTSYLVVIKYQTNPGQNDDAVSLYVLPATETPATEPATATIANVKEPSSDDVISPLQAVALRQSSATGTAADIDAIRVGTGWGSAVGRLTYDVTTAVLGDNATSTNYYDLSMTGPSAAARLDLSGPVVVEGTLNLTTGKIFSTATNSITLRETATVSGGNARSFVSGPVSRTSAVGARSLLFPIGKAAAYRPLTLNITAPGTSTTFIAEQVEGNAGQSFADPDANGVLKRVSRKRQFTLAPAATLPAEFAGTVTLSYGSDDGITDSNDAGLVVAGRAASTNPWSNRGRSAVGSGTITSAPLTSADFGASSGFTLGATNEILDGDPLVNPLPVELSGFTAVRQTVGVQLQWTTASEHDNDHFEVQRSLDGRTFSTIATVAGHGTRAQPTAYASLDRGAPASSLYYRLRQLDTNGKVSVSPALHVGPAALALVVFPNPAKSSISFQNPADVQLTYRVLNQLGQVMRQGVAPVGIAQIEVSGLAAGSYLLELQTGAGRLVRKFEKE